MFTSIAKSLFGDSNERVIKKFQPLVDQINSLEPNIEALDKENIVKISISLVSMETCRVHQVAKRAQPVYRANERSEGYKNFQLAKF